MEMFFKNECLCVIVRKILSNCQDLECTTIFHCSLEVSVHVSCT